MFNKKLKKRIRYLEIQLEEIRDIAIKYLNEHETKAPDGGYRMQLRDRLSTNTRGRKVIYPKKI